MMDFLFTFCNNVFCKTNNNLVLVTIVLMANVCFLLVVIFGWESLENDDVLLG